MAVTTVAPAASGAASVTTKPITWQNGGSASTTSRSVRPSARWICSIAALTLRCVSITPLGRPVVPLENGSSASASGAGGGGASPVGSASRSGPITSAPGARVGELGHASRARDAPEDSSWAATSRSLAAGGCRSRRRRRPWRRTPRRPTAGCSAPTARARRRAPNPRAASAAATWWTRAASGSAGTVARGGVDGRRASAKHEVGHEPPLTRVKVYTSPLTRVKYRDLSRDPGARPRRRVAARARAGTEGRLGEGHRRRGGRLAPARLLPLRQPRRAADRDGAPPRRGERRSRRRSPTNAPLEDLLRAWCDYLPEMLPVARALEAALVTGDEGGARGGTGWASCARSSRARCGSRPRARLDGRDGRGLGVGARPAVDLRPPGGRAGLDARAVHRAHDDVDAARMRG